MIRVVAVATGFALGIVGLAGAVSSAVGADVRVNIGVPVPVVPAPPVVVAPAPPIVVAPPVVVAPASIYFYGSTYYTFYNGAWYVSPRPRGPWNHFSGPPPWARKGRDGHWKEGHFRGPKH